MNILIISQYFWPESFRINDLAENLSSKGHVVTVLTGVPNYPEGVTFPEYAKDKRKFSCLNGVEVIRVPIPVRGKGRIRLAINYAVFPLSACTIGVWRLRRARFDAIFVCQLSPITSALPAVLFKRLKRAPILLWILDLWPDSLSAVGAVRSQRVLNTIGLLVKFIYRNCDRILVQSKGFAQSVEQHGGDGRFIRYFPSWVEPDYYKTGVERARELEDYRHTFNVMFAGNIGEAQDFPAILAAAESARDISDLRWFIIGSGRALDWVRREIKVRSLQDRVLLLGRHPTERMPSFFLAANALLVSLKKEPAFSMTVPGKLQNYLASGVPVLAMLDGEGARVVDESGGGLTSPAGDGFALAQSVRQLRAMTEADRSTMGKKGQDYCRQEFGRDILMSRLEGWMEEVSGSTFDLPNPLI